MRPLLLAGEGQKVAAHGAEAGECAAFRHGNEPPLSSKETALYSSCLARQDLSRSVLSPLPTGSASLGSGGDPIRSCPKKTLQRAFSPLRGSP